MGTQPGAARRHRRRAVRLGDLAAAALRRPRQPVADHRLRAPRPHRRAGAPFKPKDVQLFAIDLRLRRRRTPPTTRFQAQIERYWTLRWLRAERRRRARRHRDEGRAGARRHAAAGVPRRRRRAAAARQRAFACALGAIDLLTLDLACQRRRAPRATRPAAPMPRGEPTTTSAERRSARRSRSTSPTQRGRRRAPTRSPPRPREPAMPDPALDAAGRAGVSVAVHAALLGGALRRSRGLQPHVRGHAARGDPGQLALGRGAREGAGDRAGQPGRRRRGREPAAPPRRCRLRR